MQAQPRRGERGGGEGGGEEKAGPHSPIRKTGTVPESHAACKSRIELGTGWMQSTQADCCGGVGEGSEKSSDALVGGWQHIQLENFWLSAACSHVVKAPATRVIAFSDR